MAILCLACIVEGDGEVPAVPVLLRRLVPFIEPQVYPEVPRPIDSDGDCPKELAPALLAGLREPPAAVTLSELFSPSANLKAGLSLRRNLLPATEG